jgi:hypothetical protein
VVTVKLTASKYNKPDWKEWYNDKVTLYFGRLSKGDIRLGLSLGSEVGSIDLFVVTFGYDRTI